MNWKTIEKSLSLMFEFTDFSIAVQNERHFISNSFDARQIDRKVNYQFDAIPSVYRSTLMIRFIVFCHLQTHRYSSNMNRNKRITLAIHFQFKLDSAVFNSNEKNDFFSFGFALVCQPLSGLWD